MSQTQEQSVHTSASPRRERLESILRRWSASEPLPVGEPLRFVALTSEGSPESPPAGSPSLVFAGDLVGIAERLRAELEDGRFAHGRVWDLDATFYPWGNLVVAYEVTVGEELARAVHAVRVEGRDRAPYLFADRLDAEAFCGAVRRRAGRAHLSEELLHDNRGADRLIDAERAD
jgi:hypothetical protein